MALNEAYRVAQPRSSLSRRFFLIVAISTMADPVTTPAYFLYVAALIINPPIVGGRPLLATPDARGEVAYTFTQPAAPCDDPKCEQEIFRLENNPSSCWVYEEIRLENVSLAKKFSFRPVRASDRFELRAIGDVSGNVFTFRAHVTSRCTPAM